MGIKLIYVKKLFQEVDNPTEVDSALAVLDIDEENTKAILTFSPSVGIIDKRTAQRQAQGICKTGFLLASSKRIGMYCDLNISSEEKLPDRLLQEGYNYK